MLLLLLGSIVIGCGRSASPTPILNIPAPIPAISEDPLQPGAASDLPPQFVQFRQTPSDPAPGELVLLEAEVVGEPSAWDWGLPGGGRFVSPGSVVAAPDAARTPRVFTRFPRAGTFPGRVQGTNAHGESEIFPFEVQVTDIKPPVWSKVRLSQFERLSAAAVYQGRPLIAGNLDGSRSVWLLRPSGEKWNLRDTWELIDTPVAGEPLFILPYQNRVAVLLWLDYRILWVTSPPGFPENQGPWHEFQFIPSQPRDEIRIMDARLHQGKPVVHVREYINYGTYYGANDWLMCATQAFPDGNSDFAFRAFPDGEEESFTLVTAPDLFACFFGHGPRVALLENPDPLVLEQTWQTERISPRPSFGRIQGAVCQGQLIAVLPAFDQVASDPGVEFIIASRSPGPDGHWSIGATSDLRITGVPQVLVHHDRPIIIDWERTSGPRAFRGTDAGNVLDTDWQVATLPASPHPTTWYGFGTGLALDDHFLFLMPRLFDSEDFVVANSGW